MPTLDEAIAALQGAQPPTSLDLPQQKIDAAGARRLADKLKDNKTLEKLDLSGNYIGPDGAKAIADALKENKTLQALNLNDNEIGPEGAKAIADALKVNKSLENLELSGNPIGRDGDKAIVYAWKFTRTTRILDKELPKLQQTSWVDGMPTMVDLYGCEWLDPVVHVERITAAISKCQILSNADEPVMELKFYSDAMRDTSVASKLQAAIANRPLFIKVHVLNLSDYRIKLPSGANIVWLRNKFREWKRDHSVNGKISFEMREQSIMKCKLMFVGAAGAGKTSLIRAIRNQQIDAMSTTGIEVEYWRAPHPESPDRGYIDFVCWDFAGQKQYYAAHQLFLTSDCIYVVCFNGRTEGGADLVTFWLRSLTALSRMRGGDKKPRVFVVATHKDVDPTLRPRFDLQACRAAYGEHLDICGGDVSSASDVNWVSASQFMCNGVEKGHGVEHLSKQILLEAARMIGNEADTVSVAWQSAAKSANADDRKILSRHDLHAIFAASGVPADEYGALRDTLVRWGQILCLKKSMASSDVNDDNEFVFPDVKWLMRALQRVFRHNYESQLESEKYEAVVNRETLRSDYSNAFCEELQSLGRTADADVLAADLADKLLVILIETELAFCVQADQAPLGYFFPCNLVQCLPAVDAYPPTGPSPWQKSRRAFPWSHSHVRP